MSRSELSRSELSIAIAATVTALVMHVVFVTHAAALWRDEINSIATARVPWSDLWGIVEFESFPPLYDLLLRGWLALGGGSSDLVLRIIGSMGGVALLAAVWFASWRLGRALPVVTLALLAVNPEIIRWGASLRAWSLGAAALLLVIVFTGDAARSLSRRALWTAVAVAVLAVQLVYQNGVLLAVVLACAAVPALWPVDRQRLSRLVIVGVVAVASLLPYTALVLRRSQWQGVNSAPMTLGELGAKLWELLSSSGGFVSLVWIALPLAAIVFTFKSKSNQRTQIYLLSVAGGVTATLLLFYWAFRYPVQPWYYFGLAPLVAVAAEATLCLHRQVDLVRKVRMVVAVAVLVAGTVTALPAIKVPQTRMDVVATIVKAKAVPGDVIILAPWYFGSSFAHHYTGSVEAFTIPPMVDMAVHRYDLLKKAMLDVDPVAQLLGRIERSLTTGHSVWVIGEVERPHPAVRLTKPDPPPLPNTRWSSKPYEQAWTKQVGQFLAAHTTERESILTGVTAQMFEAPHVLMMRGWK